MYECYKDRIVEGKESFSWLWIICENLLYLATWTLAGYLLWPIWNVSGVPVLTIGWALIVVVIQILLKKHNCSGCYYYGKLCHLGWGKISSALFKQDSGDPKVGMRLSIFYIASPPVVVAASLIFALRVTAPCSYWTVFGAYVFLNVLSFPIRKKGCTVCAMREGCPGSAAKKG